MKALRIRFLNYIFNILIGQSGGAPYSVHYTSVVIDGKKLNIVGENKNRPFLKSLMVSPGCYLNCANGLTVGNGVMLGPRVSILASTHQQFGDRTKSISADEHRITIGENVWIGANSVILAGVSIGDNSIIAAGSVVNKNVPADCVCGGVPARIINKLDVQDG